jgi:hypothetical protein
MVASSIFDNLKVHDVILICGMETPAHRKLQYNWADPAWDPPSLEVLETSQFKDMIKCLFNLVVAASVITQYLSRH